MKIPQIADLKLDQKKITLIVIVCVFIIYADLNFIFRMQLNNLKALSPKISQLKKDIAALNKGLIEIKGLKKQPLPKTGVKRIISEDKIPDLLEFISETANTNNVRIMQVKPVKEARAVDGKTVAVAGKLSAFFIEMSLKSGYHNLGAFINALENAEDFLAVQDIKVSRDKSDYMRQDISLVLKTYVKK